MIPWQSASVKYNRGPWETKVLGFIVLEVSNKFLEIYLNLYLKCTTSHYKKAHIYICTHTHTYIPYKYTVYMCVYIHTVYMDRWTRYVLKTMWNLGNKILFLYLLTQIKA
jgi:hypothetical protein